MDKLADTRRDETRQKPVQPSFHAASVESVLRAVDSSAAGLAADNAARRLAVHGPNELPETAGRHPALRFLAHFHNTLIYFLLAATVASSLLGHYVDAAVILAVVLVNAIVGFVQEGKAEKALNAIRGLIAPHAHLLRDGRRESVPVPAIVPGDVVLLEAGDRVPADLRLIRAHSLLIEEAILTGESVAAEKRVAPAPADAVLGDRHSMAYSGTSVAAGQAAGVVVAVGIDTEIGRISTLLRDVQSLTTPLLRQINRFGTRFTWITIAAAAALFVFAVTMRGYAWPDALIAVVALAVGVVPEGLPAVITITLAIGVQQMARRHAAVRRLSAVETLGSTSVICTDKSPPTMLVPIVSGASLGFLALLGAIGARAGGANVFKATARVTFWGALAMARHRHHCRDGGLSTIGLAEIGRFQGLVAYGLLVAGTATGPSKLLSLP